MAYTSGKHEVRVATNMSLGTTGDKAVWGPGYVPHRICAIAVVSNKTTSSPCTIKIDRRTYAGFDAGGRGDGDVAVFNLPSAFSAGYIVYRDNMRTTLKPGEDVVVEVTTAGTAGDTVEIYFYVEPVWDNPKNNDRFYPNA